MKHLQIALLFLFALVSNAQDLYDTIDSLEKQGNYDDAINLLYQDFNDLDTLEKLVRISKMGKLHGLNMAYEKAFAMQEQAIHGFKALGNDTLTSQALYGLAKLFSDRFDYDNHYKYLKDALVFSRTPVDSAKIISNMGIYFRHQEQPDSARFYYLRGIDLYPPGADPEFYIINYNNLAILEKTLGNDDAALNYYSKAKEIALEEGDYVVAAAIDVNKTYVYYGQGAFEKAETVLNENEAIIMANGSTVDKLNFDLIRYNVAEKLDKSSETLKFYKRYRKTKDSVDNLKLNTKIAEFEVRYETAEKEKQIAIKENELARAQVRQQYLWGGLLAAVWLGLFGTLYYWSRNKYQKRLTDEKMHSLAIASMLNGQEHERLRIAKDLHDSLGGLLTTIKLQFERLQERLTEWVNEENTDDVSRLLDKASREVRRISHNMAPRALDLSGLNAALADLSTDINAAGALEVSYQWHGEEIPEQDRIMIYRIIEEACSNTMKHANASRLLIQVNVFDGGYTVLIEDDGKGFHETAGNGMGLRNIRSRASIIKADLDIDSRPGEGTSITISKAD
ncbi:tetratricopeptide repeat-containing sensor histidine kinase [Portibacter marinus]|uniref:tetratricopeptide repeat-containing sensor histidine kinase n=1 Tax=Portibacter marinus TaxID=2898660 RepID=UPI001F3B4C43|nr:sensor histidine kinase [Portibacter marinus]